MQVFVWLRIKCLEMPEKTFFSKNFEKFLGRIISSSSFELKMVFPKMFVQGFSENILKVIQ